MDPLSGSGSGSQIHIIITSRVMRVPCYPFSILQEYQSQQPVRIISDQTKAIFSERAHVNKILEFLLENSSGRIEIFVPAACKSSSLEHPYTNAYIISKPQSMTISSYVRIPFVEFIGTDVKVVLDLPAAIAILCKVPFLASVNGVWHWLSGLHCDAVVVAQ